MADEANTANTPLDSFMKLNEEIDLKTETDETIERTNQEIIQSEENSCESTEENCDVKHEETVDNHKNDEDEVKSVSDLTENSLASTQKPRKTYENRKNNCETTSTTETTSPEVPTTSSPHQNTSRYGRARKPKITEDFYNIEDIFGPYERIPSTSPRKKAQKLELSPIKNKNSVNIQDSESIDLNSVLSINIPDENSIEVSKVMKLVSNNSEFSPKSPTYSSKSVKVYGNKNKSKNCDSVLDEYDYQFLNGIKHETSDSEDETVESVNKSDSKTTNNLCKSVRLFSDDSFNNSNDSVNESHLNFKRTKNKTNLQNSECSELPIDEIEIKVESSDNSINDDDSNSTNIVGKNKKLNKLQKDLNIGELKSGRLRSSIAENEVEIIKEVKMEERSPKLNKKRVDVITIDDTEEIQEPAKYLPDVGDLAWSRVGSYPFWPSIVTVEPGTTRHFKTIIFGRKNAKCYHVHFFGDNGRRSWVLATHIFPFHRRSDLEVMAQSVSKDSKPKDPKHLSAFIINPNKLKKWETAVTEAESITDYNPELRIQKFFDLVSPKKKGKKRPFPSPKLSKDASQKKIKLDKKSIVLKKYQKKTKLSKTLSPKTFSKDKKLVQNKEIKIKTEDDASLKSPSPLIKEEPLDDKLPKTKLKQFKNKPDSDKIRKFPKTADDSKSEDSFSESSDIQIKQEIRDTPSPQPQISLLQRHKRINLFRGITKDRVCQICGKNKNVFKCKGNCFGLYHIDCDKKIRQKVLSRKIAEKSSHISSDESDSTEDIIKRRNSSTNSDKSEKSSIKLDKTEDVASIMEDILQNVFKTVDSSETTNIKTESVTIKEEKVPSLSLAEQIDLKMQEVMQNLITETKYTDSTTDEGSETEDTDSIVIDPFQSKSTSSDISQSESSKSDEYSHLPNYEEDPDPKSNNKVTRKIIKHVTADGIFDVIEEEETTEEYFKCAYCFTGIKPPCFICNKDLSKSGDDKRHKCITPQCGKYFHSECLKDWPQTKWNVSSKSKKIENETLSCPYHNCHTCISDDPRGPLSRYMNEKLSKCIRCPTTYHSTNYCIPAGSEILSTYQLICPKHLQGQEEEDPSSPSSKKSVDVSKKPPGKVGAIDGTKKPGKIKVMPHVNASWCFICSMGGSLICCETCPSSFHVECLKLVPPEGRYLCEECESGRLPLYDEIVWVKLGAYRWWPAQILYPADIPPNVASIPHTVGEFVVRFFGSHDHYWVNRGRVFLFQEGDTGHASSKKSAVDGLFVKAIQEATRAHKKFVEERANRAAEAQNGMKPPSYIKIKVNKPVGNVRSSDADTSNTTPCDCDPNWAEPCGPDSDCLNRILLTECNPMVCAAGSRCCNQSFEKRLYSPVAPFKTPARGWGLKTLAPVKKGSFVIEYVGEVIDEKEYQRRMKRKHEQKDENYYFLTIDKDRMIDAGPKGNVARFMNHSCSPNCETQKWTINGDTRVGLFAITDIPSGAELTFNYNLECIGEEKKECRCGAPNCSGFIGVKAKQDEVPKKRKSVPLKPKKKKSLAAPEIKQTEVISCFICGEPDAVQPCDRENCNKYYHLQCVNLENFQEGKWLCPWHSCTICTKRTTRCCYLCIKSYCPIHSEGNIRYDRVKGFVCSEHDIKEEDDTKEVDGIPDDKDAVKTKDPLKLKKTKKQIRNSQSEIRSSTESSKTSDDMAESQEMESIYLQNEENPKKSKTPSRRSSKNSTNQEVNEEIDDSSSTQSIVDSKEKKIKMKNRKLSSEEQQKVNKTIKENKNGASTKSIKQIELNQNEESGNSSSDMIQIDIFVNSEDTVPNNNNSAIKKRKSRLSLKQPHESSNSASNSSQDEDLSEDEPLVKLKKIKLSEESPQTSSKELRKSEETTKTKSKSLQKIKPLRSDRSLSQTDLDADLQSSNKSSETNKPNRSLSLTDFDSSSEADFVISPKKTVKKKKISSSDFEWISKGPLKVKETSKKLRGTTISEEKLKKNNQKANTEKKNAAKIKTQKEGTSKSSLKKLKTNTSKLSDSKTLHKLKKSKFNSLKTRKEEKKLSQDSSKTMRVKKYNLTKSKDKPRFKTKIHKLNLSLYKKGMRKSIRNLKQFRDIKFSDDDESSKPDSPKKSSEETQSSVENKDAVTEESNTDTEKFNVKKKKKLSLSLRKSLRPNKTDDTVEDNSSTVAVEEKVEPILQNEETDQTKTETAATEVVVKRKRGRPRNDEKFALIPKEEPVDTSSLQEEEHDETKTDENGAEVVKRKRGRPRKTPITSTVTSESVDQPETDVTDSEAALPVVKRPIGRPRKQKIVPEVVPEAEQKVEQVNQVTELYKMKLNDTVPKNPYENHVNEVKLTANVPERHLRVVLRKHSEIDSKIENKFLKMQNDIERDLPIRKRSKLRYEAQL